MKIFVLEDDENRIERFKQALKQHDVDYVIDISDVENGYHPPYDLYFLDHDLGGLIYVDSHAQNTGYTFCKWLYENHPEEKGVVVIHSLNPSGTDNMKSFLDRYMVNMISYKVPFVAFTDEVFQQIINVAEKK